MTRGEARQQLLEAAEEAVLARGLSAATVDEICRLAGVTKGAFYHHFKSKDALALAVLDHYYGRVAAAFTIASDLASPRERLDAMLTRAEEVAAGPLLRRGCLMAVFALETAERPDDRLRAAVAERFDQLGFGLETVLRQVLREQGCAPKPARAQASFLARQFLVCLEGGITLAKAHKDPERVVEAVRFYRKSLAAQLA